MQTARYAHVVTCWIYLAALVVQFGLAGFGAMGGDTEPHVVFGGLFLHLVIPAVLMLTAGIGRLGWRQVVLSLGLFALLTVQIGLVGIGADIDSNVVQGLHPAVALLSAGYVYFFVLERALDVGAAQVGIEQRSGTPSRT